MESRTREQLQQALQGALDGPMRPGGDGGVPCFTAEIFSGGTVRVSGSSYFDLEDEDTILEIVQSCLDRREDSGVLENYRLRYLREVGPLSIRIAFADSTMEQSTLRSLTGTMALIGVAAFAVLFGFSYLLSGFVTRPVEKAWQEQQRFLSDASHELKTPLTVILSSADLLSGTLPAEGQGYVDNIRSESRRMKKLVESMLTLARADDGAHKLVFSPLDFSDVVTDTALLFEPVAFEAGRELLYDIREHLHVSGDGDKLRQLVSILLDNAIKYSPQHEPIRLTLSGEDRHARLKTAAAPCRRRWWPISSTGSTGPTTPAPAPRALVWGSPLPGPSSPNTAALSAVKATSDPPVLSSHCRWKNSPRTKSGCPRTKSSGVDMPFGRCYNVQAN